MAIAHGQLDIQVFGIQHFLSIPKDIGFLGSILTAKGFCGSGRERRIDPSFSLSKEDSVEHFDSDDVGRKFKVYFQYKVDSEGEERQNEEASYSWLGCCCGCW